MPWFVNRSGNRLWYEEQGQGQVIVLLHGWCMSSVVWRCQLDLLSNSFRLVAPDLRGHGRSDHPKAGYDFENFSTDLVDLFQYLDISNALLAGWSMGGQIAMQSLGCLEERLAGLVLVSATPCFTACESFPHGLNRAEVDGMSLKLRRNIVRALDGFRALMFAAGELADQRLAVQLRQLLAEVAVPDVTVALQSLESLAGSDMRPLLASVNLPTLIINGDQDRICLPGAADYLAQQIAGSEQIVYSGCGHAPFLTHSKQFADSLIDFSRRICEQK